MGSRLETGYASASAGRLAPRGRSRKLASGQSSHRLASVFSLSMVWLLVSQNCAGLGGCGAAPRVRDLDAKQQQEQQQQELALLRHQLAAYRQLESVPVAVRRLVSGTAFSPTKLAAGQLIDSSSKKLIDNFREPLLLRQQQQFAPPSGGLEPFALERQALEERAEEEARKLLQLIGPDYEMAEERLELDKKAGAKHTPRFG